MPAGVELYIGIAMVLAIILIAAGIITLLVLERRRK